MGKIIEVDCETGEVICSRRTVEGKTNIEALMREIKSTQVIDTPVLPDGIVSYSQNGPVKIFFVQKPEALINAEYGRRIFHIAIPVQIYGMIISNLSLVEVSFHFGRAGITHEFDMMFKSCLPNQHGSQSGRLCLGSGITQELAGASNYSEIAKRVIHWIYTSKFNDDLGFDMRAVPEEIVQDERTKRGNGGWLPGSIGEMFAVWEDWTTKQGDQWRTINNVTWKEAGRFTDIRRGFRS